MLEASLWSAAGQRDPSRVTEPRACHVAGIPLEFWLAATVELCQYIQHTVHTINHLFHILIRQQRTHIQMYGAT